MLKIGYVRLRATAGHDDIAALNAAGCQVVRIEDPLARGGALSAILDFIGPGDQLVVTRLDRLAGSGREMLAALDALEARGANLMVLEPPFASQGSAGRALRAVLEAVAEFEPRAPERRRRALATDDEIFALQRAGIGPVEIARRLGVSRMTVWRKLKAVETAEA